MGNKKMRISFKKWMCIMVNRKYSFKGLDNSSIRKVSHKDFNRTSSQTGEIKTNGMKEKAT